MRFRSIRALAAIAMAVPLAGLAACGDDNNDGGDGAELAFSVAEAGGGSSIEGPGSAEPGLTEITLTNNGKKEHDLQLLRAVGDHSAQEVIRAVGGAMEGGPIPPWLFTAGGTPVVGAGESATVSQVLQPGTYFAFDTAGTDGPPKPSAVPVMTVEGDTSHEAVPEADATVTARDYSFEAEGLTAGETTIRFVNEGEEPHHLIAAPLKRGKTIGDVRKFVRSEQGPPPVDFEREVASAVIEGGSEQLLTLELEGAGEWALLCFISDRAGGPPHAVKGMISPATVE